MQETIAAYVQHVEGMAASVFAAAEALMKLTEAVPAPLAAIIAPHFSGAAEPEAAADTKRLDCTDDLYDLLYEWCTSVGIIKRHFDADRALQNAVAEMIADRSIDAAMAAEPTQEATS